MTIDSMDYRLWAAKQLEEAAAKADDAPGSAQMHEDAALYVLLVGRYTGGILDKIENLHDLREQWEKLIHGSTE